MSALQVVLITGANQGLGYLAALQLSKLPGYHILLGARNAVKGANAVKQIEAEGGSSPVTTILLDISSDESIEKARLDVQSRFGKLDVLVNNAAIAYYPGQLEEMSVREKLTLTYNTNVFGSASMITAFLSVLERSAYPRIVNVSSGFGSLTHMINPSGSYAHFPRLLVQEYNSSKSALNAMTVYFAATQRQKTPDMLIISVDPGWNPTAINNYSGPQDPMVGAAGIVRIVTAEKGEFKSGEFRDQFGNVVPW